MKKLIIAAIIACGAVCISKMDQSKKRFWWEIIRQTPYLIPRYFV